MNEDITEEVDQTVEESRRNETTLLGKEMVKPRTHPYPLYHKLNVYLQHVMITALDVQFYEQFQKSNIFLNEYYSQKTTKIKHSIAHRSKESSIEQFIHEIF